MPAACSLKSVLCLVAGVAAVASIFPPDAVDSPRSSTWSLEQNSDFDNMTTRFALVLPVLQGDSLSDVAAWSTAACSERFLPIDLVLFVTLEGEGPPPRDLETFRKRSLGSLADTTTSSCFAEVRVVSGDNIYQVFTDNAIRRHFQDYDALAVVDWQNVKPQEDGLVRLYDEIFDRSRLLRWWVMAAGAPPLEASEADERRMFLERSILGGGGRGGNSYGNGKGDGGSPEVELARNINGRVVVYNNRSRGLRYFFMRNMPPQLRDQPFDLALWATLTLTHPGSSRWGGILPRLVTADNLVGGSDDAAQSAAESPPARRGPIFVDSSSSTTIISGHNPPRPAHPDIDPGGERKGQGNGLEADNTAGVLRIARGHRQRRRLRGSARPTRKADKNGGVPFAGTVDGTLRRGQICAFVAGRPGTRPLAEVTVQSVLRFMPGIQVVVAADPSEIDGYNGSVGSLPGVTVSRSEDVRFSATTADLRCGKGAELILYLEPGTVLSRPFTEADTHDPATGELLVVHADATAAGHREVAFAASTGKLLGRPESLPLLPAFTAGTDLILPTLANRDLRANLGLPDSGAADRLIHLWSQESGCLEHRVHMPQVLASIAYMSGRPGVVFRGPSGGNGGGEEPPQLILKPRFGCQFYSQLLRLDEGQVPIVPGMDGGEGDCEEAEGAARGLRAYLELFEREKAACPSGFIRWHRPVLPGGRGVDQEIPWWQQSSGSSTASFGSRGEGGGRGFGYDPNRIGVGGFLRASSQAAPAAAASAAAVAAVAAAADASAGGLGAAAAAAATIAGGRSPPYSKGGEPEENDGDSVSDRGGDGSSNHRSPLASMVAGPGIKTAAALNPELDDRPGSRSDSHRYEVAREQYSWHAAAGAASAAAAAAAAAASAQVAAFAARAHDTNPGGRPNTPGVGEVRDDVIIGQALWSRISPGVEIGVGGRAGFAAA